LSEELYVIQLDGTIKERIRAEWKQREASLSDLSTLDSAFACSENWFGVVNGDKTEAVFDARQALKYIKNMQVIFAPDIRIDDESGDYEHAKKTVLYMVDILGEVFAYHLRDLQHGNNDYFKIYSDHQEVRFIFYEFCNYLKEQYPDKYSLKFYGKWIEIHSSG
jgi:hypothetical protein